MKRLLTLFLTMALVVLVAASVGRAAPVSAAATLPNTLLSPLVAVAPDISSQGTTNPPACTTPSPVFTYAFFHCYTPAQMEAAYGVDRLHAEGLTGKGQTIVIVDSYGSPTALQDLQFFSSTFGLPQPNLTILYPTGKPAETEGEQGFPSMFKGEQYVVDHYPGSVISQSFAVTEQSFNAAALQQVAKFDKVYQQAVANGITVVSATGDSGTANVDKQGRVYPFPTAQWPASDPLVTAAGGTWLQSGWRWDPTVSTATFYSCLAAGNPFNTCAATYLNYTTGPGRTEAVWKEDWLPAATGGGLSVLYPTPSFQSGIPQSLLHGHRGLPDVSWNAAVDGGALVYTSFGGARLGWHTVGGTSASTPQIAAMVALTNQLAAQMGKHSVGYLNPLLYTLPASDFNDIVPQTFGSGAGVTTLDSNQEYASGIPGYSTTAGWDLTTGFGSPSAFNLVHDLATAIH